MSATALGEFRWDGDPRDRYGAADEWLGRFWGGAERTRERAAVGECDRALGAYAVAVRDLERFRQVWGVLRDEEYQIGDGPGAEAREDLAGLRGKYASARREVVQVRGVLQRCYHKLVEDASAGPSRAEKRRERKRARKAARRKRQQRGA